MGHQVSQPKPCVSKASAKGTTWPGHWLQWKISASTSQNLKKPRRFIWKINGRECNPPKYDPNSKRNWAVRPSCVQRRSGAIFSSQYTNPRKNSTQTRKGSSLTYWSGGINIRLYCMKFMGTPHGLNQRKARQRVKLSWPNAGHWTEWETKELSQKNRSLTIGSWRYTGRKSGQPTWISKLCCQMIIVAT